MAETKLVLKDVLLPARLRFPDPLSERDLLRFCSDNRDFRIEQEPDGDVEILPPTATIVGSIEAEVSCQLYLWSRANGTGRVFGAGTGFRLPDGSIRAASAVWIRGDRWDHLSYREKNGYDCICPDFVVEVRSDSDSLARLTSKMQSWVQNGAQLAWLIDPEAQTATIYRPHELPELHHGLDLLKASEPVSGFTLKLTGA